MTPNNGIERTPKDEWIAQDNPVRVVDAFVEELDLGRPGFDRATPADRAITWRRC